MTTRLLTKTDAADLFRRPAAQHIDVGEGAIALRTVGSGPDLLLVHGWPVSGATFRTLLPELSQHFTCHIVDLVGAGDSHFTRDSVIDLGLHVRSVRAALDAIGSDEVRVVGFDSGGMFARHAIVGDARVRGLGLINTEQPPALTWRFKQFIWMGRLPGFAGILGFLAGRPLLRRNKFLFGDIFCDRDLLGGEFEEFFLRPLNEDADRRWAAGQLVRAWDTSLVAGLADVHPQITCPVSLAWGSEDPFFPVARARRMVESFPDASLTEIPGAKLFVHEEKPAEVAAALIALKDL